jgi:uncharacterized protein (DUF1684 family)
MSKENKITLLLFIALLISSCNNYTPEEKEYIESIKADRIEKNNWMENNSNSPFQYKGKVAFHGLNYFDVEPMFVFKSKLEEYQQKDTIKIFGTKGEERSAVRFGFLAFTKDEKNFKLNVYENIGKDGSVYYSIWFTDKTTNEETYGVGRYLNFELNNDKDHLYTIDFNLAYNPYCAYSAESSCAIPSKEDYLDLAIVAGEKKYHD